jgi:tRNA-dihydrouridine synthase
MEFGIEPRATEKLVAAVRERFSRPIIAKLTPNVTDIVPIAQAAEAGGADSLSLINTYVGMAVDWRRRRPRLAGVTGGLSGPAIKPLALRLVWLVSRACKIPVIGIGGIMNADDVLDFLVTGAAAVQLGTVQFIRPRVALEILDGLDAAMDELGISNIRELVGSLETERQAITVQKTPIASRTEDGAASEAASKEASKEDGADSRQRAAMPAERKRGTARDDRRERSQREAGKLPGPTGRS